AGYVGLADAIDHFHRKSRAVIDNGELHGGLIPAPADFDRAARKIDRVFHEVAKPVDHAGVTPADRFRAFSDLWLHVDGYTKISMRRRNFFNQRGERQPADVQLSLGGETCQTFEDLAAAFSLAPQQRHILAEPRIVAQSLFHLARH